MSGTASLFSSCIRGQRMSPDEAFAIASIHTVEHLHELGLYAFQERTKRFQNKATYVQNLAINTSNICSGTCLFCHYRANKDDPHAYILSAEEILQHISVYKPTEVHITSGINTSWTLLAYVKLIKTIRIDYPSIYIKAFTAVEIDAFCKTENCSLQTILGKLKDAGLHSLTGGGAELFSERMRKKYCPSKISPDQWIAIHAKAHELGISSNATMLYGLDESDDEIIAHLIRLRDAQDCSGGFTSFIPLSYQPPKGDAFFHRSSAANNLRIIALSRLILDNISHIKAYWPMIGIATAACALSWGADDMDGTLGKERIAHSGNTSTPLSLNKETFCQIISSAGFIPIQRNGLFHPVSEGANQ